jgi:hypothetical protein
MHTAANMHITRHSFVVVDASVDVTALSGEAGSIP